MSRSSLRDAAAIASTLCQIAKRVVLSPNGARQTASRGPPRPWPTQAVSKSNTGEKGTPPVDIESGPSFSSAVDLHATPAPSTSRPWPSKTVATKDKAAVEVPPIPAADSALSFGERDPSPSTPIPFQPPPPTPIPRQPVTAASKDTVDVKAQQPAPASNAPLDDVKLPPIDPKAKDVTQATPSSTLLPQQESPSFLDAAPAPVDSIATSSVLDTAPTSRSNVAEPPASDALPTDFEEYDAVKESKQVPLRAAKVPSSRLGRLFHYGGLGAGLAFGAAGSLLRGASSTGSDASNLFMSEQNVARLVDKLSTMRGAALKLGQFLLIQETKLLPPQIEQVLLRVQNSANYMPVWQMNKVMSQELGGSDWRERHFKEFEDVPFASASIGQVHAAVLRDDFPDAQMAGQKVAVKVQFPGVLESIDSDLSYLRWLVSASALLPKGLFLENTLRVLGRELKDECDYAREAEMGRRFRAILHDSCEFEVPRVVDSLCTGKVLTTEMMRGRPLSMASRYPQPTRDRIAQSILNLSLSELFRFRLMQTDPNWSNFLYDERTAKIQLIDFGATREYSKQFMDHWLQMLQAAIAGNYDECLAWSRKVGYLTGEESEAMERAHVESMIALGEPFRPDAPNPYAFEHQTITDRVKAQIPLMLRERLTPPPQETYSLNRKLSGAFLLCARLKAHVNCRSLFEAVEADYKFGPEVAAASTSASQNSGPFSSHEQRRQFHSAFRAARQHRKHGRNLLDRFPRSKIVLSDESGPSTGSAKIGDTVESLASAPTGSTSIQETPANAVEPESQTGIEVTRAATPAEVTAAPVETAPSMGPTTIRGIVIPLKPPPPGPEECCMSGCAHCAYDIYAEDLEDFHARLSSVRTQLVQLSPAVTRDEWRADLLGEYPAEGDGAKGAEDMRERAQREVDRVISDLDPTMKAFLEMERKLKKSEREKAKPAQT
ncbi:related to ABC1-ubiquinol--cytochrome-c reductase complex assembly protein [Sporisorium reilianum f. sp. reilianum]|uniref:Related to ABC1-ubiquinol--cytochrome-c reductase complex assembly protein n=1 Tax=Sporisorium reilianum f. sp. reilianum TaxID=72559 RepID=A0A2N8UMY3_9BASI|nr:related to ABC1-ubiquinol--cytochrome-c reductase complex assembly protein [Sporisorium reilianum f. sp. reilianum]